jgi:hypothetical protein
MRLTPGSHPFTQRWGKGQIKLVLSPHIVNMQGLGLIQLSQIYKFLRCARLKIGKPQIVMINPHIANLQISAKFYTTLAQNNLKLVF